MIIDKFKKSMPEYYLYPESLRRKDSSYFFMVKNDRKKYLVVYGKKNKEFEGKELEENIKICFLNHNNAELLKGVFSNLTPVSSNLKISFGFGDRLGLVTPAHIRCIQKYPLFFPVFAQQSIRENSRTGRNMQDVIDDVIWGCMETGYAGTYGADADHIKDFLYLKKGIKAGYSMFTIDLSDYIRNPVKMSMNEQESYYLSIPKTKEIENFFLDKKYTIVKRKYIFTKPEIKKIIITFVKGLNFAIECYKMLKDSKEKFDFEISVDEMGIPTTPLGHIFITEYLRRNDIKFMSLALCFPGEFQKAIDYGGDIGKFEESYLQHNQISQFFGDYKLSIHSGSDKFAIYPVIHKISAAFHLKTAGTSWLQAIKTIALKNPSLYRKIHNCALANLEKDRISYSISVNLSKIPSIKHLSDEKLINLFSLPDTCQLIHITYGSILSNFKEEIFYSLFLYETEHYHLVEEHLNKHLNSLGGE